MGGVEEKDGEYEVWKNSGIGDYVDVVAPAEGIWVERPSYRTRRPWPGLVDGNSLAASIVSGCAALILSAMDKQTVNYLKQTVPGFSQASIATTGSLVGIRETRRIEGDYILKADAYFESHRHEDDVCVYDYALDLHAARPDEQGQQQYYDLFQSNGHQISDTFLRYHQDFPPDL